MDWAHAAGMERARKRFIELAKEYGYHVHLAPVATDNNKK